MKKILIVLLGIAMLFGFASCDNTGSGADGELSNAEVISLAHKFYKAAADAINAGSSDNGTAYVDNQSYRVAYNYDPSDGSINITAYEGASDDVFMAFEIASSDGLVTVNVGSDKTYQISAAEITKDVVINGKGPDDPEEQQPPVDDDEEEAQPSPDGGNDEGSSVQDPVD